MDRGPLLLDEFILDTPSFAPFAGGEDALVNVQTRKIIPLGERRADGRRFYSALDAVKASTVRGVSDRVGLSLATAAMVATILANDLRERSARDKQGRPMADFNAFPRDLAYVVARVDGVWSMDKVAVSRRYVDYAGPWGRPHIVVPVAEIVADVLTRVIEMNPTAH